MAEEAKSGLFVFGVRHFVFGDGDGGGEDGGGDTRVRLW